MSEYPPFDPAKVYADIERIGAEERTKVEDRDESPLSTRQKLADIEVAMDLDLTADARRFALARYRGEGLNPKLLPPGDGRADKYGTPVKPEEIYFTSDIGTARRADVLAMHKATGVNPVVFNGEADFYFEKLEAAPAPAPPAAPSPEPFIPAAVEYDRVAVITIPLTHPFKAGTVRVRTVRLRPPRLDHIEAHTHGKISRLDVVAEMSGLSVEVLGALRWPDAERVLAAAADIAPDMVAV